MTSNVTIDQTTKTTTQPPAKKAAVNALAVVGFIALLIIGITLAIYSARYVPLAITKLGSGSDDSKKSGSLAVVTASSTIPFGDDGSVVLNSTTTTTTLTPPSGSANSALTASAGNASAITTTDNSGATVSHSRAPYGLSDLSVTIIATGYLTTDSTDSFTPANIIPPGARPAVKFSIANDGTNATGSWNFLAYIPSINSSVFNSPIEPSLNPGDHTVFTLGFNQAIPGQSQTITVQADPANTISESNESNNVASAAVTITQTGN